MSAGDHLSPDEFGRKLSSSERRAKDPDSFFAGGIAFREPDTLEEMFNDNPFLGNPHAERSNLGDTQVFYHGSDQELGTGDHIRPRTKNVAHATPDVRTAQVFGQHTYEVEPLNRASTFNRDMKYTQGEQHTETLSEEGFRVRRKLG